MKYNLIIKPEKFDRYTIVPNYIFRHKTISLGATGLYCWLFSHKSDQEMTIEFISGHFKEGRDGIRTKINELIEIGYLVREKVLDKGKFKGYNYILNDVPSRKNRCRKKPMSEIPTQSNTNINSNTIINTNMSDIVNHFAKLFDKRFHPKTKAQKKKWETILDQIQRIEQYDLREVYKICKHIREKEFWKSQFLSLPKLRTQDKNGDKWIDRFYAIYKSDHKPQAYNKIKDLIDFKIYTDVDGKQKLGAITKTTKLNAYNLTQILSPTDINEIIKYLKDE